MLKTKLCLVVLVLLGYAGPQAWGAYLAAWWDGDFPTNWADEASTVAVRDALEENGYEILDSAQLKDWMDDRIADGVSSVVVFCRDIAPDTVVETNTEDCTLRQYLDAGGRIVFYADIPFWNQGSTGGGTTNWGQSGATGIFGFSAAPNSGIAGWDSGNTVTITEEGLEWGLTETWTSQRPALPENVDIILATDDDGGAAAWVKYFADGEEGGFVRIRDTGGMPNVDDIMRVAEYGLGSNPLARGPNPKNRSLIEQTTVMLTWKPGDFAVSHDVYFGDDADAVAAATPEDADIFAGTLSTEMLVVGMGADTLAPGTTYYWRVDEVNDANTASPWKGDVWSFSIKPLTAFQPFPVDGMRNVDPDQDMTWEAGIGTIFHQVAFGTSFDEVNNIPVPAWMTVDPIYDPGTMELDTTYYWRVDEFKGMTTAKGEVWSFATRGEGGGVKAEYFDGMALAGDPILTQIEPAINGNWGSGEVAGGLLDLVSARWRANLEAPFTEPVKLITTTDDGVRLYFDGRLVIDNWTDHGTTDNTVTIDMDAGQYHLIVMEWYENGGGAVAQLSWQSDSMPRQIIPQGWLQLPLRATSPSPMHNEPGAPQDAVLSWTAGDDATGHHVYFGDDAEAVASADTSTAGIYRGQQAADVTTYNPGPLEWGKTYYWRVDEINADGVLAGAVWCFTAANFIVVDDFEGYDNEVGSRPFEVWIDGIGFSQPEPGNPGNGTNAVVGHDIWTDTSPYYNGLLMETQNVHGGAQSMPVDYNNLVSPNYSEIERTWVAPQNWTVNGVDTLTLHVRGSAGNTEDRFYVTLTDSTGGSATVEVADTSILTSREWSVVSIPMADFAGVNAAAIKKMVVGLGNPPAVGGAGSLLFDDFRVTKSAAP